MKLFVLVTLLYSVLQQLALAQDLSVDRSELAELSIQSESIQVVNSFNGKKLMARIESLPGQTYVLASPIDIPQVIYLESNGASLRKKQPFVKIQGPEVHHFYASYQMKKALFAQASRHYNNSEALYKRKSISEQAWLDISNNYYVTKMEFDELTHFFELVLNFDESNDALILGAPQQGILKYNISNMFSAGSTIAAFVPLDAIRMKVNVPIGQPNLPSQLSIDNCNLAVDFMETANSTFYQTAWSKPLNPECKYVEGQVISVIPIYETKAYSVKKSSVFNWEGNNFIFVQVDAQYKAMQINIVTSQGDNYIVQSTNNLTNKVVLTSSVSALQGMLLGLGL